MSITIYGLTFKADINDLRESPALEIARKVVTNHKGPVTIIEPNIQKLPWGLENAILVPAESASADIHVTLVDHSTFRGFPEPEGMVIGARCIWDPQLKPITRR